MNAEKEKQISPGLLPLNTAKVYQIDRTEVKLIECPNNNIRPVNAEVTAAVLTALLIWPPTESSITAQHTDA